MNYLKSGEIDPLRLEEHPLRVLFLILNNFPEIGYFVNVLFGVLV